MCGHLLNASMSLVSSLRIPTEGCVCRDVSPTSNIRAELHIKTGYFFWAKCRQIREVIGLENLLKNYWGSNENQFTVPSQSTVTMI